MQDPPIAWQKPDRTPRYLLAVLVLVILGGVGLGFLGLWELRTEQAARATAETRALAEEQAKLAALDVVEQEMAARMEVQHTAEREKSARIAAEQDSMRQQQARVSAEQDAVEQVRLRLAAEEQAEAEIARRVAAETAQAAAEAQLEIQRDPHTHAVDQVEADTARRVPVLQGEMSQEQVRAEKERVLEMARTHPMIRAVVSGELTFYFEPLPEYAGKGVSEAVDEIARSFTQGNFYEAEVRRVDSAAQADITIGWVRDYGSHTIGESIFRSHIKVGLGHTNCVGNWMAFDSNTVKKILWHEMGHAMGYGHSKLPDNVMYPVTETRFQIDQFISEIIAVGWYYVTPLCADGEYRYSFETEGRQDPFDIAVLPPGVDGKDYSTGTGSSYPGCGRDKMHRYSDNCKVGLVSRIYLANASPHKAIRLTGTIVRVDTPPWPNMTWDPAAFQYDENELRGYQELFAK